MDERARREVERVRKIVEKKTAMQQSGIDGGAQ